MQRMTTAHFIGAISGPDYRLMRRAFERLAVDYETASGPDQEIGRRLLEHLSPVKFEPTTILDVL